MRKKKKKKGLQGDTIIKDKHIFFHRLQLLLATLNVTHSYVRGRIFSHLEMWFTSAHTALALTHTSNMLLLSANLHMLFHY